MIQSRFRIGDKLTDEHAAKTPKSHREMSHQRIYFVRTDAKRNHGRYQIKPPEGGMKRRGCRGPMPLH